MIHTPNELQAQNSVLQQDIKALQAANFRLENDVFELKPVNRKWKEAVNDIGLLTFQADRLQYTNKKLMSQNQEKSAVVETNEIEIKELKLCIDELLKKNKKISQELSDNLVEFQALERANKTIEHLERELKNVRTDKERLVEYQTTAEENIGKLYENIEFLNEIKDKLETEKAFYIERTSSFENDNRNLKFKLEEQEDIHNRQLKMMEASIEESNTKHKDDIQQLNNELSQSREEARSYFIGYKECQDKLNSLNTDIRFLLEKIDLYENEINEKSKQIDYLELQNLEQANMIDSLKNDISIVQKDSGSICKKLELENTRLVQENTQFKSEIDSQKLIIKRLQSSIPDQNLRFLQMQKDFDSEISLKDQQIHSLHKNYQLESNDLSRQVNGLENQNRNLQSQNAYLISQNESFQHEIEKYRHLNSIRADFNSTLHKLSEANDKLREARLQIEILSTEKQEILAKQSMFEDEQMKLIAENRIWKQEIDAMNIRIQESKNRDYETEQEINRLKEEIRETKYLLYTKNQRDS